jgi:hypothetical protein
MGPNEIAGIITLKECSFNKREIPISHEGHSQNDYLMSK